MPMTQPQAYEILDLIENDETLRAKLTKLLVNDRGFIQKLVEALHEADTDGVRLPGR